MKMSILSLSLLLLSVVVSSSSSVLVTAIAPSDNICITWAPLNVTQTTPPLSTLVGTSYNWLFVEENTNQCVAEGHIIPCFATDDSAWTFGQHGESITMGYTKSSCQVAVNSTSMFKSNNMFIPAGPQSDRFSWKLVEKGDPVPDDAIRFANKILVKSAENAPGMCAGKGFMGWAETTSTGQLGLMNYPLLNKAIVTDKFSVAVCKPPSTPIPSGHTFAPETAAPTFPPMTRPFIRFADAIPADHHLDAELTQGSLKQTWTKYTFGKFSSFLKDADFTLGSARLTLYEVKGGSRTGRLASADVWLRRGPCVLVAEGAWPPTNNDTQISVVAGYRPDAKPHTSAVRLANLIPDAILLALTNSDGVHLTQSITYQAQSDLITVAEKLQTFNVINTMHGANNTIASLTTEPPAAPRSFTFYLIGLLNATKGSPYAPRMVPILDQPNL